VECLGGWLFKDRCVDVQTYRVAWSIVEGVNGDVRGLGVLFLLELCDFSGL